ncbi:MAG: class B sortase [Bacilli bacterium]|nr:class B sortase [Bacilli bacterium]MDD3304572.1 class B sortase [Bacilli bacterium]MDD4053812.1 class B sortase [Bacilli bacterium]MDD4411321.1 class B sortase [Bacilli bacterium]
MKKKTKYKLKNSIILIVFIVCFIFFIISLFNILKWKFDSHETEIQIEKIHEEIVIEEISDTENTEIIEQVEVIPKFNPYWDYIKMNMINVNFTDLKETNNHTMGWIQVNGTNINYPFVQTKDNKYYLNHTFDKSYNEAGWVFSDYRNKLDGTDKNTIIYAHGRIDTTMFGSLKNILKSGWLKNSNNYVVKLSTEYENTLWQVFSVYHIPTTSDYIQTEFRSENEYQTLLSTLINRSSYNFNTSVDSSDNILTLSTCYNEDDKVVLHAKLIKKETR